MPAFRWLIGPLPCRVIVFEQNVASVDSTSPYCKRFGDNFDQSKMFTFGAEVRFVPSKIAGDPTLHFDSTTQPGDAESILDVCGTARILWRTRRRSQT
jgi:hypothetical protein